MSTFLDKVGAITMPEALVPWLDGRSLVLAGNVRQLPPRMMTFGQKSWTGGPLNFLDKHQEISVLERILRMKWSCWSSQRQNHIVNGGFDLAREIFYPDLGESLNTATNVPLANGPVLLNSRAGPVGNSLRSSPLKRERSGPSSSTAFIRQ